MESESYIITSESPEERLVREDELRQRAIVRRILEGMPRVEYFPTRDEVYVNGQQIFFDHIAGMDCMNPEKPHDENDVANPLLPRLRAYVRSLGTDQRRELVRRAKEELEAYYDWHERAF